MRKLSIIVFILLQLAVISGILYSQQPEEPTPNPSQEGNKKINPSKEGKEWSLEEIILEKKFAEKPVKGIHFFKDGRHFSKVENYNIIAYDLESSEVRDTIFRSLIPAGTEDPVKFGSYQFSKDEKKILLATDVHRIYRRSKEAHYFIWDRKGEPTPNPSKEGNKKGDSSQEGNKKLTALSDNGKQQYPAFSPDATKVAFVRDNNLFIKDLNSGKELQVTHDGKRNEIINGSTDWVYEEELRFTKAFFWSPEGKKIAFYRFDEREVPMFSMTMYNDLYPKPMVFKYPKVGEKNAVVTIHVYDLETKHISTMDIGSEIDQYIPRIKWTQPARRTSTLAGGDENLLCIQRMNRHQNKLELLLAEPTTGKTKVILTEESKYYIDVDDDLTFLEDGKHFIWTSEKDGFNHIYLHDLEGNLVRQITKGEWEVTKFYGIDEKSGNRLWVNGIIYYQSTEVSPLERHIYSIQLNGSGKIKLSQKQGVNNAQYSPRFTYYINKHSNTGMPTTTSVHKVSGEPVRVIEDNADLKELLKDYPFSKKEFFQFTTSEGVQLNGWMIKPYNFDPAKKYPIFMSIYGGPGSQTVRNNWSSDMWHQYIASKGYIVASVDNRGTGGRGEEFKKMTYLKLGIYETIDQIEAAKYLASLPYVEGKRIGIFGWSYGGYLSSLCILKGADVFKMAIAVAPIAHWKYYDGIYTERYMRTVKENPQGYEQGAPLNYVDSLKGKYLLIHGTADDNVHFQNTIEMINGLIKANKQFDLYIYPNRAHGIRKGKNTRYHLYTKMSNYIFENL